MQRRNVTPHLETIALDAVGGTYPLPGGLLPTTQSLMVLDSITLSITADGAEDISVEIFPEDQSSSLFKYSRTYAAAERDIVHTTFPRGLVLHKFMQTEGTGQVSSQPGMAAYLRNGSGAILTLTGTPTTCQVLLSWRWVHPSDVGT